jgi:hypothetical protein
VSYRTTAPARRRWLLAAAAGLLLAAGSNVPSLATPGDDPGPQRLVFNGEGNRLWIYDADNPDDRQILIRSQSDAEQANDDHIGLDLNAQICTHTFKPQGAPNEQRYFIAGEDTFQDGEGPIEGEPGWGWFELKNDEMGEFEAIERGKLIPTWKQPDGQENYGCGFLPNGNLLLSDVGGQQFQDDPSGQLHLWFLDDQTGFADETNAPLNAASYDDINIDNESDGDPNNEDANAYCMIDRTIGTAGGIAVDGDWAYVASNRPGPNGPGGIYRYRYSDLRDLTPGDCDHNPATVDDDDPATTNDRDIDLAAAGIVHRELWLPSDAFVMTPSALVKSGRTLNGLPTWYVSSVFTGVIAEYVDTGTVAVHVRNVVEPPAGLPLGQLDTVPGNTAGTPYGVALTGDGAGGWHLWWADLGIQITVDPDHLDSGPGIGPASGAGSFQRVHIAADGTVGKQEILNDGRDYPDGVGVMVLD